MEAAKKRTALTTYNEATDGPYIEGDKYSITVRGGVGKGGGVRRNQTANATIFVGGERGVQGGGGGGGAWATEEGGVMM